jgi:uncharacterized protein
MASTCPTCHREVAADAAYCSGCGGAIAATAGWSAPGPGEPGTGDAPGSGGGAGIGGGPSWGAPPRTATSDADARNLALLAHLSALVLVVGIPSFVGPLVVWLWKRGDHPFVAEHAREALNFHLSVTIYAVVGGLLAFVATLVTFGLGLFLVVPIAIAAGIAFLVLIVVAAVRASNGEGYRYPLTIRMIR